MMFQPASRPSDRLSSRRRGWRPGAIESLEGRALLAASPVVPTFNGGQPLVSPLSQSGATLNNPAAAAVQPDGKIVVVGTGSVNTALGIPNMLLVARYNPDGTADPTFGTDGLATVALPTLVETTAETSQVVMAAGDVLIQTDGRIVLDANLFKPQTNLAAPPTVYPPLTPLESVVVRLTKTGALDQTFGINGQAVLATNTPSFARLALQDDGRIVLAGTATVPDSLGTGNVTVTTVVRLAAGGTTDPSFNQGNPVVLAPNIAQANPGVLALALTSNGSIKVVSRGPNLLTQYIVDQMTPAGTPDLAFGTGGSVLSSSTAGPVLTAAVTRDGQVYIASLAYPQTASQLIRLRADGSTDTTFNAATPFAASIITTTANGSILVGGSDPGTESVGLDTERLGSDGKPDPSFGTGGVARFALPNAFPNDPVVRPGPTISAVAPLANGQVLVAGGVDYVAFGLGSLSRPQDRGSQAVLALLKATNRLSGQDGDYDGDNRSDIAAQLSTLELSAFAYRRSTGGDVVVPNFGTTNAGVTLQAPGDYDGDGLADVAAYLPQYGILAYRASSGTGDREIRFGPTGLSVAVPVPGDYDGDGKTDVALFVPGEALYLIMPSGGAAPYAVSFGAPGAGQSLPVPGDYDGAGRTELAVYIPATGQLIYRSPLAKTDVGFAFGPTGVGASIPLAGDYDGDGLDDLALYLPDAAAFAIRPSSGGIPYAVQFGFVGNRRTIPLSGDYDGDGKTDVAAFLPGYTAFAYRPSGGGSDVIQQFGVGLSVYPAAVAPSLEAIPRFATPGGNVSSLALRADDSAGVYVYLPDDLLQPAKPAKTRPAIG